MRKVQTIFVFFPYLDTFWSFITFPIASSCSSKCAGTRPHFKFVACLISFFTFKFTLITIKPSAYLTKARSINS
jgi:hypothetical protein